VTRSRLTASSRAGTAAVTGVTTSGLPASPATAAGDRVRYRRQPSTPGKRCIDCDSRELQGMKLRPAPYPGPRCATHHRQTRQTRRETSRQARRERTYGLSPERFERLWQAQGRQCAGCHRKVRRPVVDHDHACCPGPTSCGRCVRGLLCDTCNRTLGRFRDNPQTFFRLGLYLINPPGRQA
jgi:hypothetical protein